MSRRRLCLLSAVCAYSLLFGRSGVAMTEEAFLLGYFEGAYHLVGQRYDSAETFSGRVVLEKDGKRLKLTRRIDGEVIRGSGEIYYPNTEFGPILKLRFSEQGVLYESGCLFHSDMDNYPRISCVVYRPGIRSDAPGREVLFAD